MRQIIDEMFKDLAAGPEIHQPSRFWQQLNEQNINQLEATGIGNLKRTLAQNYFTWVVGMRSPLFKQLASLTSASDWVKVLSGLPFYCRESGLGPRRFYELQIFTRMVWLLAERIDQEGLLPGIEEPAFGNPFNTKFKGRLISQDLANSMMELYAITEGRFPDRDAPFKVLELGAGYGRNAYAFLSVFSRCKYIIVDIPPALYVSQEYISTVFPDKKIMKFRPFKKFSDVEKEFNEADVVFLLPHQMELLKTKSIDCFINISSFHEMTFEQVNAYFKVVERLTKGYFYLKQWLSFVNVRDNITIGEENYPFQSNWQRVYRRVPPSHPSFFEALYKID